MEFTQPFRILWNISPKSAWKHTHYESSVVWNWKLTRYSEFDRNKRIACVVLKDSFSPTQSPKPQRFYHKSSRCQLGTPCTTWERCSSVKCREAVYATWEALETVVTCGTSTTMTWQWWARRRHDVRDDKNRTELKAKAAMSSSSEKTRKRKFRTWGPELSVAELMWSFTEPSSYKLWITFFATILIETQLSYTI